MVRCKFMCNKVAKLKHWNKPGEFLYEAEFSGVSDGSPENKAFFEATPGASLKLATYKENLFEPGKEYYLDISLAEPPSPPK